MGLFSRNKISKEEMATVQKLLKQSNDCARIESTTMNVDEFYEEYDRFENCLTDLIKYEKYRIFSNMLPSDNLKYIRSNRVNDENAMINRTYRAAKAKADKKKTTGEKNAVMEEYFSQFDIYRGQMDSFNMEQLARLKEISITEE